MPVFSFSSFTFRALSGALLATAVIGCGDLADEADAPTRAQQLVDGGVPSLLDAEAQVHADAGVQTLVDAGSSGPQVPAAGECPGGDKVDFSLVGWATQSGGTTGGKGGRVVPIRSAAELVQALKDKKKNPAPLTLLVEGTITAASAGVSKFDIKEIENLSLIGAGAGATFDGIGIKVNKSRNIVIRNLRVQKVRTGDKDAISIEGPVDHVWVDHCELSAELAGVDKDDYDGLLDTKAESAYLTYSWNYLHDSWKASLVGSSESDTFDRKLTLHHNHFARCNSRLPLFRGGTGHLFNNYYEDVVDTAINARVGACLKVEANLFRNVKNPWISAFSDLLGGTDLVCNALQAGAIFAHDAERREPLRCTASIPYEYRGTLNRADAVADIVTAHAGVGKLADPTAF